MPIEDESRIGSGASTRARSRALLFRPITTSPEARWVARRAAIVALIFAVLYLIGIYATMQGFSTVTGQFDPEISAVLGIVTVVNVIALFLILFLAWRISTGRGFVSATVLLVWFAAEATIKVIGGSAGIGLALAYVVMVVVLADGVRATWAGSKLAKVPDQTQIGVFD